MYSIKESVHLTATSLLLKYTRKIKFTCLEQKMKLVLCGLFLNNLLILLNGSVYVSLLYRKEYNPPLPISFRLQLHNCCMYIQCYRIV